MFMKYKELLNKMKEFDYYMTKKDNIIDMLKIELTSDHKTIYNKIYELEKQNIILQCQKCIIKSLEQRISKLEAQIEKRNSAKNKKS